MLKLISAVTIAFLSVCSTSVWALPFTDAGGRTDEIPDNVTRVLTAGPPASVLVYVLAPEKLTGWVREPSGEEKRYLLSAVHDLPTYGRLTGQGGTANMEAVIGLLPLVALRWRMNVMTLGDEEAQTLGVDTRLTRLALIFIAAFRSQIEWLPTNPVEGVLSSGTNARQSVVRSLRKSSHQRLMSYSRRWFIIFSQRCLRSSSDMLRPRAMACAVPSIS